MVKEQNLALNPAKISGICGRLMCCMAFEHDMYHQLWENLPNPGTKIKTPGASYVLSGIDIRSNSVRVFHPEKGETLVNVDDFDEFKAHVQEGKTWDTTRVEGIPEKEFFAEMAVEADETPPEDLSCQKDLREGQLRSERDSGSRRKAGVGESPKKNETTTGAGTGEKKKRRRSSRKKPKHEKKDSGSSTRQNQQTPQKDVKGDSPEKTGSQRKPKRRKQRKKDRQPRDKS